MMKLMHIPCKYTDCGMHSKPLSSFFPNQYLHCIHLTGFTSGGLKPRKNELRGFIKSQAPGNFINKEDI